jgi:hypothetical protein
MRFEVGVGRVLAYCSAVQTVKVEQARLEVAVGAVDWYSSRAVHVVKKSQ